MSNIRQQIKKAIAERLAACGSFIKPDFVMSGVDPIIDDYEKQLAALEQAVEASKTPCVWAQQDDEWQNLWETSCGNAFVLEEGTPEENDCKFCTYCGHPLTQKLCEPPNWEDE
jgi:hypothetical protein